MSEKKKLSILIGHLTKRKHLLERLMERLKPQLIDSVEVVIEEDQGQLSIGAKRNVLVSKAVGEYIVFVDDDDLVSYDYVAKILKAVENKPDCCSLWGRLYNKKGVFKFHHSIKHNRWYRAGDVYCRNPNHLNAVKRELAEKVPFKDINEGEDRDYSMRLQSLLFTETEIEGTIYGYIKK